jgi:hypothetical protein
MTGVGSIFQSPGSAERRVRMMTPFDSGIEWAWTELDVERPERETPRAAPR